jgi:hypothetical protein
MPWDLLVPIGAFAGLTLLWVLLLRGGAGG